MNIILRKIKDILIMLLPLFFLTLFIQLILYLYTKDISLNILYQFIISNVIMFFALFFLLIGLDFSILEFGEELGSKLVKKRFYFIITIVSFIGILITICEPDLYIVAYKISSISPVINLYLLILTISISIGVFLLIAIIRLLFNLSIKYTIIIMYIIAFSLQVVLTILNDNLVSISYDIGAATTGVIIVPFILSLGIGLSKNKVKKSLSDSFGLVAIVSVGALIGSLIYFIFKYTAFKNYNHVESSINNTSIFSPFIKNAPKYLLQTAISILPFILIFIILQIFTLKLKKQKIIKISKGFVYIFIGLFLFLLSSNIGFTNFSYYLGDKIRNFSIYIKILISIFVGLSVIIAEPSAKVLANQIYKASYGAIKKRTIIILLSLSVGIAMVIILLRARFSINLVYIIMPLYLIALILIPFTSEIFYGISFDSGSVASGPLTSVFILSFIQGLQKTNKIEQLYGSIAIVSVIPIIFLLILGIYQNIITNRKKEISNEWLYTIHFNITWRI